MTHVLIDPIPMNPGYVSGCVCGYRTDTYASVPRADFRAIAHIRLMLDPLSRKPHTRPPIDLGTATASFLDLLLRGVDENVPASRGGWPL